MESRQMLLENIDKIHTTEMGIDRIKKNLKTDMKDVVGYCKGKVSDKDCIIYRQGKTGTARPATLNLPSMRIPIRLSRHTL